MQETIFVLSPAIGVCLTKTRQTNGNDACFSPPPINSCTPSIHASESPVLFLVELGNWRSMEKFLATKVEKWRKNYVRILDLDACSDLQNSTCLSSLFSKATPGYRLAVPHVGDE